MVSNRVVSIVSCVICDQLTVLVSFVSTFVCLCSTFKIVPSDYYQRKMEERRCAIWVPFALYLRCISFVWMSAVFVYRIASWWSHCVSLSSACPCNVWPSQCASIHEVHLYLFSPCAVLFSVELFLPPPLLSIYARGTCPLAAQFHVFLPDYPYRSFPNSIHHHPPFKQPNAKRIACVISLSEVPFRKVFLASIPKQYLYKSYYIKVLCIRSSLSCAPAAFTYSRLLCVFVRATVSVWWGA